MKQEVLEEMAHMYGKVLEDWTEADRAAEEEDPD